MDKQCCGTCEYWELKHTWGDCKYPVPNWSWGKNETGAHYGTACPCWQKRSEA